MFDHIIPHNIADLYKTAAERYGDHPAIAARKNDSSFTFISYRELLETGSNLATALIELGLQRQELVAIVSNNCLEWLLVDCAVQLAGAADVPCGTNSTENEVKHILNQTETRFVFVENIATWEKFCSCFPTNAHKILMSPSPKGTSSHNNLLLLQDLIVQGAKLRQAGNRYVEERLAQIQPEDLFTLIYTSGAAGQPKGVQLTHANAVSQLQNLPFPLRHDDRALSILPIWHSYERIFEMVTLSWGVTTYYSSLRTIAEDLKTVQPTIMCSAPRLWEGIYHRMLVSVRSTSPIQQKAFHFAYEIARRVKTAELFFRGNLLDLTGRCPLETARLALIHAFWWIICILPHCILDKIVLEKIRAVTGGKFRGTISGGGALQPHVDEFFNFIGIPVLEGYGLTETSPIAAVRTWEHLVIGTVGPLYPKTEVRIVGLENGRILYPDPTRADHGQGCSGEIHIRGPQVMKGYYKNDAVTASTLYDGWLRTGDIGMMTFNNCLKILGRVKDTIVLLSGENVEPLPIESCLLHSPFIEQCLIVGQNEKHLGALIVPDLKYFASNGIIVKDLHELSNRPEAIRILDAEIRRLINPKNGFKSFERIVPWRIIPKLFETGDELTQTFKLRRYVITEKYAHIIQEMFHSKPPEMP